MTKRDFAVAALLLVSAAPAAALTGTSAWEFQTPGTIFSNNSWSFGAAFTVNSKLSVTGLGVYSDGATPNSLVNLYACASLACDTTGSLIASATVNGTGTAIGHFVFAPISGATLNPGNGYLVVGTMPFGYNYTWDTAGFATDSRINYTAFTDRYTANLSAAFDPVNRGSTANGYWGANLLITGAVPEPASWAMLIAGFGLTGAMMRRRRSTAIAA